MSFIFDCLLFELIYGVDAESGFRQELLLLLYGVILLLIDVSDVDNTFSDTDFFINIGLYRTNSFIYIYFIYCYKILLLN